MLCNVETSILFLIAETNKGRSFSKPSFRRDNQLAALLDEKHWLFATLIWCDWLCSSVSGDCCPILRIFWAWYFREIASCVLVLKTTDLDSKLCLQTLLYDFDWGGCGFEVEHQMVVIKCSQKWQKNCSNSTVCTFGAASVW